MLKFIFNSAVNELSKTDLHKLIESLTKHLEKLKTPAQTQQDYEQSVENDLIRLFNRRKLK